MTSAVIDDAEERIYAKTTYFRAVHGAFNFKPLCVQNAVVSGVVRDKTDREPLPYAHVFYETQVVRIGYMFKF
jgi:hypothetical protein